MYNWSRQCFGMNLSLMGQRINLMGRRCLTQEGVNAGAEMQEKYLGNFWEVKRGRNASKMTCSGD